MDTNICGLNKVVCRASSSSYAGRTVTITNGVNTWSGTIANITGIGYACVFMVPSLPAPAKRTYTVTLYNSAGTSPEYQRDIELGFGDSIVIGLYTNAEIADKAYVLSEIASHAYVLPKATSSSLGGVMVPSANGLSVDANGNVRMSVAGTSSVGVVKPGTGLNIDSTNGTMSLAKASSADLGGVKVGTGLAIDSSTGVLSIKKANTGTLGGVIVGTGLSTNLTTGEISLKSASDNALGGIKYGKGLYAGTDGATDVQFSRQSISKSISSQSIAAHSAYNAYLTFSSSDTNYDILRRSIPYAASASDSYIIATVDGFSVGSSSVSATIQLFNPTGSSITVTSISLKCAYFS